MIQFQFIGFTPREAFKEAANAKVNDLVKLMPANTHCSARVVKIDDKFFFQVMFVSKTECFVAKEVLDPKAEDTNSRAWQVVGIERIINSLSNQMMDWRDELKAA